MVNWRGRKIFFRVIGRHSVQRFITCLHAAVQRQRTSIDERVKPLDLTTSPCSGWTGAKDSPAPKTVEVTQRQHSCMTSGECPCYPRSHTVVTQGGTNGALADQ